MLIDDQKQEINELQIKVNTLNNELANLKSDIETAQLEIMHCDE